MYMYLQEAEEKDRAMKKIFLLSLLVFVAACDEPSQKQRFADQISRVGIPPDATNVVILDEYWYTFEWKGQCFLGTKFYRNSALTKIDCEE